MFETKYNYFCKDCDWNVNEEKEIFQKCPKCNSDHIYIEPIEYFLCPLCGKISSIRERKRRGNHFEDFRTYYLYTTACCCGLIIESALWDIGTKQEKIKKIYDILKENIIKLSNKEK